MNNLYIDLTPGDNPPKEINVVVENPLGERNKYEYKEEGYFSLDRVIFSPVFFPFGYGFIPQTLSEDEDPIDVVLLLTYPVFPGCVVKARPIGILFMEDEKGKDNKIIAVPLDKVDPHFKGVSSLDDMNEHIRKEIQAFFTDYKKLEEGKFVKITGWGTSEDAEKVIKESIERYQVKL